MMQILIIFINYFFFHRGQLLLLSYSFYIILTFFMMFIPDFSSWAMTILSECCIKFRILNILN